jgi:hypothetical protein
MNDLPTTAIGLIAFIVAGAGWLIFRLNNQTILTFMTYIEKKNGNLERTAELFVQKSEEQQVAFGDMLMKQGERHQQALDDLMARFDASAAQNRKI